MPDLDPVRRSLLNALTLILILYIIAIPFYMHYEKLSFINALYFTSMTITTVGYGDIAPQTDIGKLFTILLAFSGISVVFYHITHLGQLRERTMDKRLLERLSIFRSLTSFRGSRFEEKKPPPKFIQSFGKKIGEV